MLRIRRITLIIFISLLTACASNRFDVGKSETVLPLSRAWVDGQKVEYVTTDISDLAMAKSAGVNYVPRLKNAVTRDASHSLLERVYKFPNGEQISIFQSAPAPIGGENTNKDYSPLWRLVLVKWAEGKHIQELRSEESLLAAEERGDVALTVTDIVVNCPITKYADGQALKGVR